MGRKHQAAITRGQGNVLAQPQGQTSYSAAGPGLISLRVGAEGRGAAPVVETLMSQELWPLCTSLVTVATSYSWWGEVAPTPHSYTSAVPTAPDSIVGHTRWSRQEH